MRTADSIEETKAQKKPRKTPKTSLSVKQRRTRFVKEYLLDHNATKAAIRAGYSENGAGVAGTRLLKDASVRTSIEAHTSKISAKMDVTAERILLELARLAFYDPRDYWNADGSAKAFTELSEDARRAIAGFEMAELFTGTGEDRGLAGYVKKFKLADKGLNLERLGRHLQMFPTKVDVSATLEIHRVDDRNLTDRIDELLHDLGLARAIDEVGRVEVAHAGTGATNGKAKTSDVLS